ncbi:MAG: hypothetical protein OSA99_20430 [Acidimicrobiales bacterium]|nr:hypothetical protein [Acidimicrobiales bacterium]
MSQKKLTGKARREAARRVRVRKQRIRWASAAAVVLVALVLGVSVLGGGSTASDSDRSTAAPEFSLARFGGGEAALSDYLDKPIAITFMHTY